MKGPMGMQERLLAEETKDKDRRKPDSGKTSLCRKEETRRRRKEGERWTAAAERRPEGKVDKRVLKERFLAK